MNKNTEIKVELPALKKIFNAYSDADKLLWDYFNKIDVEDGLNFLTIPEKERPKQRKRDDSFIPAVVMLAFTVELGLKTLHFQENESWKTGHDLEKTFHALSKTMQRNIKQSVCSKASIDEVEFDRCLRDNKDTFVNWRYFFDKDEVAVKSKFLMRLKEAIMKELM